MLTVAVPPPSHGPKVLGDVALGDAMNAVLAAAERLDPRSQNLSDKVTMRCVINTKSQGQVRRGMRPRT